MCSFCGSQCSNGVLIWTRSRLLSDVSDGLSKTIIVAEQTAPGNRPENTCTQRPSARSFPLMRSNSGPMLWGDAADWGVIPMETAYATTPPGHNSGDGPGSTTVVRWPINTTTKMFATDGLTPNGQYANGINSIHAGGANVLFCDGTVKFLSQDTTWDVLKYLCILDDGVTRNP
jgi:prepilin-type processing-associated H-X9-DG protein